MISIDLKSLVGRMNEPCRIALEGAAGLCLSRTHYNVEVEHWLLKLLDIPDSDMIAILEKFEINLGVFAQQLNKELDLIKSGNSRAPALSQNIVDLTKNAWLLASVEYGHTVTTSAHILCALLMDENIRRSTGITQGELKNIAPESLRDVARSIVGTTTESASSANIDDAPNNNNGIVAASKQPSLDKYTVNLTQAAKEGKIDAVLGRDEEVRQIAPSPIIMFIDEAHTLIGAGGKEGQGDAANLLKPALARGELRTIAATTWAEYKKYFERDPALTRRFQVVKIEEPSEEKAINMMRAISGMLSQHHGVNILDEAICDSVKLSSRYIPGRQLPDKSVSLLDTACARVALSQSATPAAIEDTRLHIAQADATMRSLGQENAAHDNYQHEIDSLTEQKSQLETQLQEQLAQWEQEKERVKQLHVLQKTISDDFDARKRSTSTSAASEEDMPSVMSEDDLAQTKSSLHALFKELEDIQGKEPMIQVNVTGQAIAEVVANWTGIPVGKMVSDEINAIMQLSETLNQRVIGQSHALDAIAESIRTSRAGLTDPRKPIGVFFMVGSSGVGKTETALALADTLYGGEQNITTINMSEFKEEHKVSMLLGSPPGYVGYGEGGVLTEAVRRKPYSVVLLDEMEKAHPGVQDIFYNLFDKGTIKDGEGRDIDFRNTVIIMTSNAAEEHIRAICAATPESRPEPEALLDTFRPQLLNYFKPAFLGRTTVIPYYPLGDEDLMKIGKINMNRIAKRVRGHYDADFTYDDEVLLHIIARCQEVDTGARNIENILTRSMLPQLASECLSKLANNENIDKIHVIVNEDGQFTYEIR